MEHGAFARLRKELLELAEDPPAGCWCDDTASYVSHPFLQPGTHEEPTTHSQRGGRIGRPWSLARRARPTRRASFAWCWSSRRGEDGGAGELDANAHGEGELLPAFRALLASPEAEGFLAVPEIESPPWPPDEAPGEPGHLGLETRSATQKAAWLRRFHRREHDALARQCTETFARSWGWAERGLLVKPKRFVEHPTLAPGAVARRSLQADGNRLLLDQPPAV
ncbi:unnamed protein product [Effrenium voratum]|nr:unnamed protein product [Effrenium voratum]